MAIELKILTSNSTRPVLDALIPAYEKSTGNKVSLIADSAKAMVERIKGGETGDIVVLGSGALKDLSVAGFVTDAGRRPFARAVVGVGVRSGTPHPDISSLESFKKSLLAAKSIPHTTQGASGMYIPVMLEKIGIAAEMKPKTVTRTGGYIGRVVVSGEAEVALQQIPELMAVPGLDVVGPLPAEVQKVFETSIGLVVQSSNAAAAEALVQFFRDTTHGPLFQSKGLEQAAQQ